MLPTNPTAAGSCGLLVVAPRSVGRRRPLGLRLSAAVLVVALGACGERVREDVQAEAPPPETFLQQAVARDTAPGVTAGEQGAAVAGVNALGLGLYHQATPGDSVVNVAVSGWAASVSLAKLGAGAASGTAEEFAAALGSGLAWDRLHAAQNALGLALTGVSPLRIVGQAWGQTGYGYRLAYLGVLDQHYGVIREVLDFAGETAAAREALGARRREALGPGVGALPGSPVPGEDSRLVLADTLALDAAWSTPFDQTLTRDDWFELLNGDRVRVPTMVASGVFGRYQGEGFVATEVPLETAGLSLLVFRPDPGRFAEVQRAFGPALVDEVLAGLQPEAAEVRLPRFALEFSAAFAAAQGLGLAATKLQADFSGIDGSHDLFVADSGHHTAITVDESGARFAHQTLVTLDDAVPETWTSPADPGNGGFNGSVDGSVTISWQSPFTCTTQLQLGSPFLFFLRDRGTGVVLFTGRVLNPDPAARVTPAAEFEGVVVCTGWGPVALEPPVGFTLEAIAPVE